MQHLIARLIALPAVTPGPIPQPVPEAPPGLEGPTQHVLNWIFWFGIVAGVGGIMICAVMIITGAGRNRSVMAVGGASGIAWVLLGLSILIAAAGIVARLLSALRS